MDKKMENVCLRIAKMSCACVAQSLAGVNGLPDISSIRIRVRDRNRLMTMIHQVIQTRESEKFIKETEAVLSVQSVVKLKHSVNWVQIFLQSVEGCGNARVCQKRILDLLAAERYLQDAYDYDVQNRSSKAMQFARRVVTGIHSEKFLEGFTPYGRPKIDANIRASLERRAFDTRYAYTSFSSVQAMAEERYRNVYQKRKDFFLTGQAPPVANRNVWSEKKKQQTRQVLPLPEKTQGNVMDMNLLAQLYGDGFADLPLKGKRRKFVNLAARSHDLMAMPKRMLPTKRRFLEIESLSKHSYIYGFYDDGLRGNMQPEAVLQYYLQKEAEMYQVIRYMADGISLDGRTFVFPDGICLQIPPGETAYGFLHKVNVIYAAIFGFSAEDTRGGAMWLEDSVRSAYTDEGVADYRLGVVRARMNGQMK